MALFQHRMFRSAVGAALTALCGLTLWSAHFGVGWVNASYDCLFRFIERNPEQPRSAKGDGANRSLVKSARRVVIIKMDNESYAACGQTRPIWDRGIHAQLLNRLAQDRPALVIFDVFFRNPREASTDQELAEAMQRLPKIALMARTAGASESHVDGGTPDLDSIHPVLPMELFLKAVGSNWGVTLVAANPDDFVVRQHWPFPLPGPELCPSLPRVAVQLLGVPFSVDPPKRWLRYYGENGAWDQMSYTLATNKPPNYFTDKIVFIGNEPENSLPRVTNPRRQNASDADGSSDPNEDKFNTPYTSWTGKAVGGVEILATELLNLLNEDWLERPPWWLELTGLLIMGILLGGGVCRVRPGSAMMIAGGSAVLVGLGAIWLTQSTRYWFPWLVVAGAQAPCAAAWALLSARFMSKDPAISASPAIESAAQDEKQLDISPALRQPDAPDYEIFDPPFGEGAFGKVWLARNAIGQWQALKAVYASKFGSRTKPYDREFNGIRRYKPISDKHPGLLRVDFVSKKKREGYFYYVMELGDGVDPGWREQPAKYKPRDLARVLTLSSNGRLPMPECVRIGIALADALQFLHDQSLTHGDVKPQNIIFINGQPKLADVGLVGDVVPADQKHTWEGTPGYMPPPPEPPGTPVADVYALGMVLYVMFTGRDAQSFPALKTTLMESANPAEFMRLNSVILQACHPEPTIRFASAGDLANALREVQRALEQEVSAGQA
ncbi:MAG TPA: CHASE2 domain-containing protein [Verrucomicrobiae bacterium]|nr:CHASE2 domain-containing protein [Verrucomicrobiae bacterium]